ncbi:ketopantoate reductase family protein [Paenibacillus montanisoli]|nr:2-dehydropantoate 2-reductase [Paenibacillus montanisoli]
MILAVIGAGGVGAYCGGMLSPFVNEVVFVARGEHLQAMRRDGLIIQSGLKSSHFQGTFTDDFKTISQADLLLFTVNSYQTAEAAKSMLPYVKPGAVILTLQNGVDNEEILTDLFGRDQVISGIAYLNVKVVRPGVISQENVRTFVIGHLSENTQKHVEFWNNLFNKAGLNCSQSLNIVETKWVKYLWNVTFNPLSALKMATVGDIPDDAELRRWAEEILRETVCIGRALGVDLKQEAINEVFPIGERVRSHKPSMLQHREQGKKMEIESLCGYLVRKAQILGIEAPVIKEMYNSLLAIEEGQGR